MCKCGEGCTSTGDLPAIFCAQACPQSLRHPGSAIVRCTAANANDEMAALAVQRGADQLTHAVGCSDTWIAALRWHQRQPRAGGHLQSRRLPIAKYAIE